MVNPPVLLVTGASSGIGEAAARLFAKNGYRVALAARRIDRLQALAREIEQAGGQALPVAADLASPAEIPLLAERVIGEYGQIDVLFNNAGFGRLDWLDKLDPLEDIQAQIQVNLVSMIQMCRAVLPHMIERRQGQIINMASIAGLIGTPTYSVYAASKFGVRGFTEALRREVGVYGIRVSGIYPGAVQTEFSQHTHSHRKTGLGTPAGLRLQSEDVAKAVWGLVQHPRRMRVIPWVMLPAFWGNALFPGIADWLMEQRFTKKERE